MNLNEDVDSLEENESNDSLSYVDIDAPRENSPQHCTVYVSEIYEHLRSLEVRISLLLLLLPLFFF
jgi:hypothetical protein